MQFSLSSAEVFIPDGADLPEAAARTTHLAVGAHQDDLEIMAFDGIIACFQQADKWFSGVVVTNGGGSPRAGVYADNTDEEMMAVRRHEQKKAAVVGEYAAQFLLNHPSAAVKDAEDDAVTRDLAAILDATRPEVVYTHNPADSMIPMWASPCGWWTPYAASLRRCAPKRFTGARCGATWTG